MKSETRFPKVQVGAIFIDSNDDIISITEVHTEGYCYEWLGHDNNPTTSDCHDKEDFHTRLNLRKAENEADVFEAMNKRVASINIKRDKEITGLQAYVTKVTKKM